ncbi:MULTISPECIES: hypothetical protein [Geobacillus]|nr:MULTISPECIES: hypothetical protein [Geobacillus]
MMKPVRTNPVSPKPTTWALSSTTQPVRRPRGCGCGRPPMVKK